MKKLYDLEMLQCTDKKFESTVNGITRDQNIFGEAANNVDSQEVQQWLPLQQSLPPPPLHLYNIYNMKWFPPPPFAQVMLPLFPYKVVLSYIPTPGPGTLILRKKLAFLKEDSLFTHNQHMKILFYTKPLIWKLWYYNWAPLQCWGRSVWRPCVCESCHSHFHSPASWSKHRAGYGHPQFHFHRFHPLPRWRISLAKERREVWGGKRQSCLRARCYTSTPFMSDPSKIMLKSCSVCKTRMRELTIMRSRRRAFSSYIRLSGGHSANNGIHWASKWSL